MSKKVLCLLAASLFTCYSLTGLAAEPAACRVVRMAEVGCTLNNLAQEMSPLDEGFRYRINQLFTRWQSAVAEALRSAQQKRLIRRNVDPESAALFFVASLVGCIGMAKNAHSVDVLKSCLQGQLSWLEALAGK